MITEIKNAHEALLALNENFNLLATKKRHPLLAREVNNTIGKMTNVVKTQLMQNMWVGNKTELTWLSESNGVKKIGNKK